MTRIGRRFPVHRGFNPPLLGVQSVVTRDSVAAGAYTNASTANTTWTHTPVGRPNFVMMWVALFYAGGAVGASLNGIAMNLLFNYNYVTSGYAAYVEGWYLMGNLPLGPWSMVYTPGSAGTPGSPYATCNSVAYNNVGRLVGTVQGNSTPLTIPSGPLGSIITTGSAGWQTAGGQYSKLAPPPGAVLWDSATAPGIAGVSEPMSIGEIPGVVGNQTINWASTAVNGFGLCAVNLLPRIPQPLL